MARTSIALLLLALLPTASAAQGRDWSLGVQYAGTLRAGGPLSRVQTARFGAIEIHAAAPIRAYRAWTLEYSVGLIPLAWVDRTALGDARVDGSRDHWEVPTLDGRATSTGLGVKLAGLRAVFGRGRIRVQADVSGSVMGFKIPTPSANSTRLNFAGEAGLGLQALFPDGHVVLGYRLHHMSNGGRGDVNPGIDSHMLVLGFWLDRKQTRVNGR